MPPVHSVAYPHSRPPSDPGGETTKGYILQGKNSLKKKPFLLCLFVQHIYIRCFLKWTQSLPNLFNLKVIILKNITWVF